MSSLQKLINPVLNVSPVQPNQNRLGNPSTKDTNDVAAHPNKIISIIGA